MHQDWMITVLMKSLIFVWHCWTTVLFCIWKETVVALVWVQDLAKWYDHMSRPKTHRAGSEHQIRSCQIVIVPLYQIYNHPVLCTIWYWETILSHYVILCCGCSGKIQVRHSKFGALTKPKNWSYQSNGLLSWAPNFEQRKGSKIFLLQIEFAESFRP